LTTDVEHLARVAAGAIAVCAENECQEGKIDAVIVGLPEAVLFFGQGVTLGVVSFGGCGVSLAPAREQPFPLQPPGQGAQNIAVEFAVISEQFVSIVTSAESIERDCQANECAAIEFFAGTRRRGS